MLLLAHLAKVQGLKGEFILHEVMDDPEDLQNIPELFLAPPGASLDDLDSAPASAREVKLRSFRHHQDRTCVAFENIPDRTSAESFKGWGLWTLESHRTLPEGESYRHSWVGCRIYVKDELMGEVLRLDPTPMEYDMIQMRDLRKGRTGLREIPFIKSWFTLDLDNGRIDLDPPEGLLDLDKLK